MSVDDKSTTPPVNDPIPDQRASPQARTGWLSRRSALVAGAGVAFGYLFGDRVRHQLTRSTNPVVDDIFEHVGNALGQDLLKSTVTMLPVAYGTLPSAEWEIARSDPAVTDAWNFGTPPDGFVSAWVDVSVDLVARRPIFFTGARFLIHESQPLADRFLVANAGGGDGDTLHCYIGIQDEKVSIRYSSYGGELYEAIRIQVSQDPATPTTILFTVLPRDPVMLDGTLLLNFAPQGAGEHTTLQVGPFTASGVPSSRAPGLSLGGMRPEVSEQHNLDGPFMQMILGELGLRWPE